MLSFGGSKLLCAGRGGALLARSAAVHQRARLALLRAGNVLCPLSELQAVVLLPQLLALDARNEHRWRAVRRLETALPGLRRFANRPGDVPAFYKVGWRYDATAFGLPRARLVAALRAEGIALDEYGNVSEGSGQNLFLVQEGALWTPPLSASILPGITRDAVMTLARDLGWEVQERQIPRGLLYSCDELFFTGPAVEITPIRSIDRVTVGDGRPGPIAKRLIAEFNGLVRGEAPDRHGWLTPVERPVAVLEG